jgi:hypothetical protein
MNATKRNLRIVPNRSRYLIVAIAVLALSFPVTPLAAQEPAQAAPAVGDRGPVLSSSEIQQGAILLHFAHADGGLRLDNPGRGAFEIAGADHVWFPAEAHLVNGIVVVSTSLVQQPIAVRYNWTNIKTAALFNGANLPAGPFQTHE